MELLAKSAFSFLHGSSHPEKMIVRAAELGHSALALTDINGLYGSARAQFAAQKHGIRAIVSTTLTQLPGHDLTQLPILVQSRQGYQTLSHILTNHHCLSAPVIPDDLRGLHAIFTPESLLLPTRSNLLHTVTDLKKLFGSSHLSIALFRHRRRGEDRLNRLLIDLAQHLKLPLLATNAPLHAQRSDRLMTDAFTCLRHYSTLDDAGRLLEPNAERFLKSPQALQQLFSDLPRALVHARELTERCQFSLNDLGYRFPSFHDPNSGKALPPEEEHQQLRSLTTSGLKKKKGTPSNQHYRQLEHELCLISKLGFSGYFLIVWDLVRFARSQGILCQGRGSAANSLVCYALSVTSVDPVEGGLLFERFLSENRRSWPDVDIDFPSGERRESVIQYVYQKYAPRGAAMTANVITYRPRSAFREMSKVLGFPEAIANRFSDLSSGISTHSPKDRIMHFTQIVEKSGIPASHPRFEALLHLYHAIQSLPRHLGQHSGGMVICDQALDRVVPLEPATMPGRTVLQWDKDDCEDLGIVKVDLLGLGMLASLEDALHTCRQRGHPIDLSKIPKNDPATYDLLCRADTIGTFQVESRAQMATLPIMKPRNFYDLAVEVAIIRPGPIVGDLVHPYLNRRTDREKIDYIHPLFEPILKRTLGVPLFQEQVLRMAMEIADFTGTEADELRRAMSFKRSDERMKAVTTKLQQRMQTKGICKHVQEKVIHSIGSFALYGFPESHAISFALIAYASCWLKAHHPAEFYCGLINNQPMGFYSVNTLLQDAKRHGVRHKPISIFDSQQQTTVIDDHTLRLGFHRLKGLHHSTVEKLLFERSQRHFDSLADFLTRVQPNKKERRILASSGALNDLPKINHRRDALWQVEALPPDDLFFKQSTTTTQNEILPMMQPLERLTTDFALQGHTGGAHPMRLWRKQHSEHHQIQSSQSLCQLPHGTPLKIAGLVICRQRPSTAKGHCFISLEDEYGIANAFVPRTTFHAHRLTITSERFLLIHGHAQITEGRQSTIYALKIEALPSAPHELETLSHDFH